MPGSTTLLKVTQSRGNSVTRWFRCLWITRSCSVAMEKRDQLCIRLKQRAMIEFLAAEGCTPKQIYSRLRNVYGDTTIDVSNVRRWVAAAKNVNRGLLPILDKMRSRRPKTAVNDVNIGRVDELIRVNRWITQDEIAAYLDISHERVKPYHQ